MKVTFDAAKDVANHGKHGVSLAKAAELEWDTALIWPDLRRDYGEPRQCRIGYIGLRLYAVLSWIAPKAGASSAYARPIDAR